MCWAMSAPERCQRIRGSTAKLCLRSWTLGGTAAGGAGMAIVIFLKTLPTPLRARVVGGPGAEPVALGNVARQRLGDAWVQRHQPGAIEFRFPDRDDPCFKVDVVAQQPDCLADPHA